MKRLVDLAVEDLVASPVWRYEGGEGAEALASPSPRESLSRMDDDVFLAATDFELFDSSRHFGFCFPADDSGVDYLQPVILTRSGQVSFWFPRTPSAAELDRQWKRLGREPAEIFPVVFRCLVDVDGRTVRGRIDAVEALAEPSPPLAGGVAAVGRPRRSDAGEGILRARPTPSSGTRIERRMTRRRKAEMTVEFTQEGVTTSGVTGDLSRRGLFVRSPHVPGTGPAVRLTIHLPEGRRLVLTGKVVRTVDRGSPAEAPGFGLRLADDLPGYDELFPRRRKPD